MEVATSKYIDGIKEAFEQGMRNLQMACELYVQAIDEDYRNKEIIQNGLEHVIPRNAWSGMEQAGRGLLDRRLTFDRGGRNARFIKKLPISDQKRIMDGDMVELLTVKGDSINVDARKVTAEQAKQLFDGDSIRSLSEQRAYMESVEREWEALERTVEVTEAYRIERGRLIVPKGCILTKQEVLRIAMEMNG